MITKLYYETMCVMFLWHHVSAQKVSDTESFENFSLGKLNLYDFFAPALLQCMNPAESGNHQIDDISFFK